ncbi:ras-like protein family member 11A-like [Platysternon megacephalum]|uniref:Ras-like protein family member 11A-like n=1 Tax=Platysternon megacephalum TaxID=55544 RepID=A0A4D9F5D9_9SAUR|nr:ras-like protein family member 11A-like [Platysternon megacephalum]
MRVELLGGAEREYFQVVVRLRGGVENTAPFLGFTALLVAEVDQFVLTALTPDMPAAEDLESPPDLLLFSLTAPWSSPVGGKKWRMPSPPSLINVSRKCEGHGVHGGKEEETDTTAKMTTRMAINM